MGHERFPRSDMTSQLITVPMPWLLSEACPWSTAIANDEENARSGTFLAVQSDCGSRPLPRPGVHTILLLSVKTTFRSDNCRCLALDVFQLQLGKEQTCQWIRYCPNATRQVESPDSKGTP